MFAIQYQIQTTLCCKEAEYATRYHAEYQNRNRFKNKHKENIPLIHTEQKVVPYSRKKLCLVHNQDGNYDQQRNYIHQDHKTLRDREIVACVKRAGACEKS